MSYFCNKCGHLGPEGPAHCRPVAPGSKLHECEYDAVKLKDGDALTIQEVSNTIAQFIPIGYTLSLRIERGSAWVELTNPLERPLALPDATDKSLYQQINDALCVACGWPA